MTFKHDICFYLSDAASYDKSRPSWVTRQWVNCEKQKAKKTVEVEEEKVKTYMPTHRRSAPVKFAEDADDTQGEISTNMAIIQRISTLERKVYNLEQHVYGLKH